MSPENLVNPVEKKRKKDLELFTIIIINFFDSIKRIPARLISKIT